MGSPAGPARKPMRRSRRFVFTLALGSRLRELRRKAGLTQQALAVHMGLGGKGSHALVGRLERGQKEHPSLGLVADYLRACGAGFKDVIDILDAHTGQAALYDRVAWQAQQHEDGTELWRAKSHRPPEPARRVGERTRHVADDAHWQRRLRLFVDDFITSRRLALGRNVFTNVMQNHARGIWCMMARTREDPAEQERQLARALDRLLIEPDLPAEAVRQVHDAVVGWFRGLEPVAALPVPRRAGRKRRARPLLRVWLNARTELVLAIRRETEALLEQLGVPADRRPRYVGVASRVCDIVDRFEPGSARYRQAIDAIALMPEAVEQGQDPALVFRVAGLVAPLFEQARRDLPRCPRNSVRPATSAAPGQPRDAG